MTAPELQARVWVREDGRAAVVPPPEADIYTAPRLRDDLSEAAALTKNGDIVVLLADVAFLDSSALGALIAAWKRARDHKPRGQVYLVGASYRIKAIFEITGTDKLFRFADDADALPVLRETERCV